MANLSSFFPEAAAGGGIGKTVTVGDYSYPNAIDPDLWYDSATYWTRNGDIVYGSAYQLSSDSPYHHSAAMSTSYTTIANVTSAANGGALYLASFAKITYTSNTNFDVSIKITIDGGTAVEKRFDYTGFTGFSGFIGHGYVMASSSLHTYYTNTSFSQHILHHNESGQYRNMFVNYDTTNDVNYSTPSDSSPVNRLAPMPALMCAAKGIPYLYFETSCKVEMKRTSSDSISGFATILTF